MTIPQADLPLAVGLPSCFLVITLILVGAVGVVDQSKTLGVPSGNVQRMVVLELEKGPICVTFRHA